MTEIEVAAGLVRNGGFLAKLYGHYSGRFSREYGAHKAGVTIAAYIVDELDLVRSVRFDEGGVTGGLGFFRIDRVEKILEGEGPLGGEVEGDGRVQRFPHPSGQQPVR